MVEFSRLARCVHAESLPGIEQQQWHGYGQLQLPDQRPLGLRPGARQEVVVTLVADVSRAYFQLRALDLELEISKRTLASRQESLRLTSLLADRGSTSMLDVRQAEQLVYTAGAEIPALEQQIEQQENFISILLGSNPGPIPRGRPLTQQPHAAVVPAGLSSSLLERRPDILQAEQQGPRPSLA